MRRSKTQTQNQDGARRTATDGQKAVSLCFLQKYALVTFFSLVETPEWTVIEVSMQFGTVLYGTLGRQRKVYGAAE